MEEATDEATNEATEEATERAHADASGTVADETLRPALELGFAVALVMSKQRPPLPVPTSLRPYLRFQKLPTSALAPLRRAIEHDEAFRSKVMLVADEAIIGRPAWLWLARPAGWCDELVAELVDGSQADDVDVDGDEDGYAEPESGHGAGAAGAATVDDADAGGADRGDSDDAREERIADAGGGRDRVVRRVTRQPQGAAAATSAGTSAGSSTGTSAGRSAGTRAGTRAGTGSGTAAGDRRLARRFEAAEQALVRARLDAAELRSQVEVLTAKSDDQAARKALARVSQLEAELRGARRRLDDAQAELATARERASESGRALTEAGGALARVEAERDQARAQAEAQRARLARLIGRLADLEPDALAAAGGGLVSVPPGSPASPVPSSSRAGTGALPPEARELLGEVAQATRRLGEVLDVLTTALDPTRPRGPSVIDDGFGRTDPVDTSRTRLRRTRTHHRRRPLPLPGGVLADSVAAAEHLLRQPATVLVDGYNVAKLGWPALQLAEQRARLLGVLDELEARFGADIRVVFDGAATDGPSAVSGGKRHVPITFSPAGVLADDVLVEIVGSQPIERPMVVVTNDQDLRRRVGALGANVMGSEQLLAVARR